MWVWNIEYVLLYDIDRVYIYKVNNSKCVHVGVCFLVVMCVSVLCVCFHVGVCVSVLVCVS